MGAHDETEEVLRAKDAARESLESWGIEADPRFLRWVENFVFEIDDRGTKRILRLTEPTHRAREMVESELDWISHCAAEGISVAAPVRTRSGSLVVPCELEGSEYTVALFEFARGRSVAWVSHPEDWCREIHEGWGELLGRLHVAQRSYKPSPGVVPRPHWSEESRYFDAESLFSVDDPILAEFRRCVSWLHSLPESPETFGLVHYDVHQGNFFIDEAFNFTLFDFDDSIHHWFAMDLAIPVYSSHHHPERVDWGRSQLEELLENLLVGYQRHHPIDDVWIERIWGFVRWRRVQLAIMERIFARHRPSSSGAEAFFRANRQATWLEEFPLV